MNIHATGSDAAMHDDRDEAERRKRARFNAKLLGLLTLGCYVGFIFLAAIKSFIAG